MKKKKIDPKSIPVSRIGWIDNLRFDLKDVEVVGIEHSEAIVYRMRSGISIAYTWNNELAKEFDAVKKYTIVSIIGMDDYKKLLAWIDTLKRHEPIIVA